MGGRCRLLSAVAERSRPSNRRTTRRVRSRRKAMAKLAGRAPIITTRNWGRKGRPATQSSKPSHQPAMRCTGFSVVGGGWGVAWWLGWVGRGGGRGREGVDERGLWTWGWWGVMMGLCRPLMSRSVAWRGWGSRWNLLFRGMRWRMWWMFRLLGGSFRGGRGARIGRRIRLSMTTRSCRIVRQVVWLRVMGLWSGCVCRGRIRPVCSGRCWIGVRGIFGWGRMG